MENGNHANTEQDISGHSSEDCRSQSDHADGFRLVSVLREPSGDRAVSGTRTGVPGDSCDGYGMIPDTEFTTDAEYMPSMDEVAHVVAGLPNHPNHVLLFGGGK